MYCFKALVHDVEPLDPRGGRGVRVAVDVICGAVAAGDVIAFIGPGETPSAVAPVDAVATSEPEEWGDEDGRRPAAGSRLLLTVAQPGVSQIYRRGLVRGASEGGEGRPILSPWAAVFELLRDEDDALALADLARADAWLLANGERLYYFLGIADSQRGVAQVLVERLHAMFGDTGPSFADTDFVSWGHLPDDDSTPQQRAELVARLAAHGIALSYEPIRGR